MTVIIYRWMDVYPEQWTVHRIMSKAYDVMCTIHFAGYTSIQQKIGTVITYHLI